MHYDHTAIPDAEVPVGVEPAFRHTVTTYASEVNKTTSVWRAVPDGLLDFRPRAGVGVLAAGVAHLPPPHPGADLAAAGRGDARPGGLRPVRRRDLGRGRPDVLAGSGEPRGDVTPRSDRRSGIRGRRAEPSGHRDPPATASALGSDFSPTVFTAQTR